MKGLFVLQGSDTSLKLQPTKLRSGDVIMCEEGSRLIQFFRPSKSRVDSQGNVHRGHTHDIVFARMDENNHTKSYREADTDDKLIVPVELDHVVLARLANLFAIVCGLVIFVDDSYSGVNCLYISFFTPPEAARIEKKFRKLGCRSIKAITITHYD